MMIGLVQPGTRRGHVAHDDRLAEDDAAEDVADRAVRRPPHLLQAELLDPGLVRGDRRALDADAVLLDGVGGVDRHLVVGLVAVLDRQVVVLEVDVEVRQDQLLPDLLPDDPGHLVAVELDDRVVDLDLRHRPALLSRDTCSSSTSVLEKAWPPPAGRRPPEWPPTQDGSEVGDVRLLGPDGLGGLLEPGQLVVGQLLLDDPADAVAPISASTPR